MDEIEKYKNEINIQKRIAYTAGLLQGDVTIKTLIESLAEGVVIINEGGRIILINDRLAQLTGFDKREVMGESLTVFLPEDLGDKHAQHIMSFFSQPRIRPMGIGFEIVAKRKDNSIFPVEISLSYLDTESDKLGIAFITDISARKKAEDELMLKNKELDTYAHTVAHDLNASLSGMVGFSEILLDSKGDISDETKQEYLKHIAHSGRKMSSIIKEILLFATMKKEDVEITKVDMRRIIDSALQRLNFQIEEKSAQIEINDSIQDCYGYSAWIEEVWLNYISNAINYGEPSPVIIIGSEISKKDYIRYYVKDHGEGVSSELKAVIFDENNPIKDKLIQGMGLGLSIVKRIIEKLDGFVNVESEQGKGSIFSFYMKA